MNNPFDQLTPEEMKARYTKKRGGGVSSRNPVERAVKGAGQRDLPRYTVIRFDARHKLDLSNNEYILAAVIHTLSSNKGNTDGWCYASKDYLAKIVGISRRAIHTIISRLVTDGLIIVDPGTHFLRTTEKWYHAVEVKRGFSDSESE